MSCTDATYTWLAHNQPSKEVVTQYSHLKVLNAFYCMTTTRQHKEEQLQHSRSRKNEHTHTHTEPSKIRVDCKADRLQGSPALSPSSLSERLLLEKRLIETHAGQAFAC